MLFVLLLFKLTQKSFHTICANQKAGSSCTRAHCSAAKETDLALLFQAEFLTSPTLASVN